MWPKSSELGIWERTKTILWIGASVKKAGSDETRLQKATGNRGDIERLSGGVQWIDGLTAIVVWCCSGDRDRKKEYEKCCCSCCFFFFFFLKIIIIISGLVCFDANPVLLIQYSNACAVHSPPLGSGACFGSRRVTTRQNSLTRCTCRFVRFFKITN